MTFDVTMGNYDGVEICHLVGLYILEKLGEGGGALRTFVPDSAFGT